MNFKRKKPHEKKVVEWGSPKSLQQEQHDPASVPAKKPKNYCIKLKGDHDYIKMAQEHVGFLHSTISYYACRGCEKRKIEINTDDAV